MRTSVLSKRWIDLWTFVPRLNFDASKDMAEILSFDESLLKLEDGKIYRNSCRPKRRNYVKWVNKVLQSHKSVDLDMFRICFDLNRSYRHHIDRWLQFVFARRVERLELPWVLL
ncbi:OLC1v1023173C1 [Oldenlandia corymbosa var. corymbosa]|uniref:OLC1v1023173C1 n=1 Tax=Oldenlandia corymbosa var. corymbosa TaxID=529605 RepID=A0AAV1BZD8_OLDCO|nr:OLC1v1023173C1 [Oldenlandia corymbosa var. corymbosa]